VRACGASRDRQSRAVEGFLRRRCGALFGRRDARQRRPICRTSSSKYSPDKAKAALAKSGFSTEKPAKIKFAATNGHFRRLRHRRGDRADVASASASRRNWKRSNTRNIRASIAAPSCPKRRFTAGTTRLAIRRLRRHLLNPKMRFSAGRAWMSVRGLELFNVADYDKRIEGYRTLNKVAVEAGATIPLLQSVVTVVAARN